MTPIRVLITGAGSGVGQGIIKALRLSELDVTVIASDITPLSAALFRADEALIIPKVESPGALSELITSIRGKKIDVLMIGSEFDLEFIAEHKSEIEQGTGALVIASHIDTVRMGNDKWLTAEFLRTNGLPYPESVLIEDSDQAAESALDWGYPVVLKTRHGTSSRHVHIIDDEKALRLHISTVPAPMLQRAVALPSDDLGQEMTCSVFHLSDKSHLGPFTARRTLRGGSSWHVECREFPEVHALMNDIAGKTDGMGSLNVQLMLGKDGPVPFEINARFSGTTAIRAHFGFNEPEMCLRHYFLKQDLPEPEIKSGIAIRYLEEVFIDEIDTEKISQPFPQGSIYRWF